MVSIFDETNSSNVLYMQGGAMAKLSHRYFFGSILKIKLIQQLYAPKHTLLPIYNADK